MTIGLSGISASLNLSQSFSGQGKAASSQGASGASRGSSGDEATISQAGLGLSKQSASTGNTVNGLTPEQQQQVDKLKATDRRVRAHEQAHLAAGGGLVTGGAVYQYQTGPDGKQYAVGGEVHIDTGEEKDPEATLRKAEQVKAAALAPADPSGQDRSVAASADAMAAKARLEIMEQQTQGSSSGGRAAGGAQSQTRVGGATTAQVQSAYTNKTLAPSLMPNLVA